MLKLNEAGVVQNPAETLQNETGIFEVTSPTGDKLRVNCQDAAVTVSETVLGPKSRIKSLSWQIQKIAELPAEGATAGQWTRTERGNRSGRCAEIRRAQRSLRMARQPEPGARQRNFSALAGF